MTGTNTATQKQILAVCLALLILVSAALGGAAYLGYSRQNELAREKAELQAKYEEAREDAARQLLATAQNHQSGLEDFATKIAAVEKATWLPK